MRATTENSRSGLGWWRAALLTGLLAVPLHAEEWLDRVGDALSFHSADGRWRARVSGSFDLELYHTPEPVSDLIFTERDARWNPRLTLFLDAQLGEQVYAFAQVRADRGFDPNAADQTSLRLDEYAVRFTPWRERRLNLQVGQFATVVGSWAHRHLSWENPFVTPPLPYDNLTGMWDRAAVPSAGTLLAWSHVRPLSDGAGVAADKDQRVPIIWGPSYTTGAAVSGASGRFEYALEVKNGALSSRPEVWNDDGEVWREPTISGRIGWRPNVMWNLGVSASRGPYLHPDAAASMPVGESWQDFPLELIGHDVGFAWHHWQVWAEVFAARFEVPRLGAVETFAYYLEAKYKLTPRWALAVRWNEQRFGDLDVPPGQRMQWGRDVWRIDVAPTLRLSPHVQLKVQVSWRHESPAPKANTHSAAAQLTVRF